MRSRHPLRSAADRSTAGQAMVVDTLRNPAAISRGPNRATCGLAIFAMLSALAACGGGKQEPPPASAAPTAQDTVFDDMTSTMDKARGVQDTVDQQKRELDREVQAAEGAEQ